jgi:hypothetical protein
MSTLTARRGLLILAVASALLVGSFAVASSASASTLYACVKKNGSAHVFAKKPKCKKGEKKLAWGTTGSAGKNGSNGSNGTAGKEGPAGQPQSAVTFKSSLEAELFATKSAPLFSLGGVSVTLGCSNALVADSSHLDAAGPAGTRAVSGMTDSRTNNKEATQEFQQLVYNVPVATTATPFASIKTNGSGVLGNVAHVNASIVTSGSIIVIDAFLEVNEGSANCVTSGVAFSIPA